MKLNTTSISKQPSYRSALLNVVLNPEELIVNLFFGLLLGVLISLAAGDGNYWTLSEYVTTAGRIFVYFELLFIPVLIAKTRLRLRKSSWEKFISTNKLNTVKVSDDTELAPPGILNLPKGQKKSLTLRWLWLLSKKAGNPTFTSRKPLVWHLLSPVMRSPQSETASFYEGSLFAAPSKQWMYASPIFIILRVELDRSFPHILLDGMDSKFKLKPPANFERYDLEGSFHQRFKLWFEKGDQVNALSLITPDIMQALDAIGQQFDVEIIGKNLYIYTARAISPDLDPLLQAYAVLMPEIDHASKSAKDTQQPSHYTIAGVNVTNSQKHVALGRWAAFFVNMLVFGAILLLTAIMAFIALLPVLILGALLAAWLRA